MKRCTTTADVPCDAYFACEDDIRDFINRNYSRDTTLRLALGRDSVLAVEQNTGPWWCGDVPRSLDNKLRGRQRWLPVATYVALDPSDEDNYYVRFADGKSQWVGPESFTEALQDRASPVEVVCFAPYRGWFVQWEDGVQMWDDLPSGLHKLLRNGSTAVQTMSCGEYEEWFVMFKTGTWRAEGHSNLARSTIAKVHKAGNDIITMEFGSNGSFVIMHA